MPQLKSSRRFRINPFEIAIFSAISLICIHSLYDLFYTHTGLNPSTLPPMSSNPISEGRSPATQPISLATLSTNCNESQSFATQANKIRLTGTLCGINNSGDDNNLKKTTLKNSTTTYEATVFASPSNSKFSTEYIQLNQGENKLHLEFLYSDGNRFSQDLTIQH